MADILDPRHEALVEHLFRRTCRVLGTPGFELKPLRRRARGKAALRSYALGYTRLDKKVVTIDLYMPRTQEPREVGAILRVVCHELAHHQEPPRLYRAGWGRTVRRIHHPAFWRQVKKNVAELQADELLGPYLS